MFTLGCASALGVLTGCVSTPARTPANPGTSCLVAGTRDCPSVSQDPVDASTRRACDRLAELILADPNLANVDLTVVIRAIADAPNPEVRGTGQALADHWQATRAVQGQTRDRALIDLVVAAHETTAACQRAGWQPPPRWPRIQPDGSVTPSPITVDVTAQSGTGRHP